MKYIYFTVTKKGDWYPVEASSVLALKEKSVQRTVETYGVNEKIEILKYYQVQWLKLTKIAVLIKIIIHLPRNYFSGRI